MRRTEPWITPRRAGGGRVSAARAAGVLVVLLTVMTGCGRGPASVSAGGVIEVVAAENFWGSIAAQLGGSHAEVTSIVTDPNADPHEYETSSGDARAVALANYVIVNGAGYDDWAAQLLNAGASPARHVLTVATLLGRRAGDNPHFWYDPASVQRVIDRITSDYTSIDPADAAYFRAQQRAFEASMQPYRDLITTIGSRFGGVKVAATESIAVYLCGALHLDLVSPSAFMDAVAEGNEPPTPSVVEMQQLLTGRGAAMLLYNVQTVTAVTTHMEDLAHQNGIATVGITETMQPPGGRFQDWQVAQLQGIAQALAGARQ
jgi:zinc/manganese transport system substrate-binding protein